MKALVAALNRVAAALEALVPVLMQINRDLHTPQGVITYPDDTTHGTWKTR